MAALTNADDEVELLGAALAGTEALLDRTIAQALEEADQDRAREQRVDDVAAAPSPAEKQPDEPPSQPSRALLHSLHLCGNQIYGAFVLNRRVDLHAIDAAPAR